jgi:preprotein translocase subunit SecG
VFLPLGVFSLSQYIFGSLLFLLSTFIIGIILLQRGKGGGLTGALGGLGGQSAFGVKAGDLFTRITAVAVLIWIFLCALACRWYLPEDLDIAADPGSSTSISSPSGAGSEIPGLDLSQETVPGFPSSPASQNPQQTLPSDGTTSLNLPPQTPTTGAGSSGAGSTGAGTTDSVVPESESPKLESSAPETPAAAEPPAVQSTSEKQP